MANDVRLCYAREVLLPLVSGIWPFELLGVWYGKNLAQHTLGLYFSVWTFEPNTESNAWDVGWRHVAVLSSALHVETLSARPEIRLHQ